MRNRILMDRAMRRGSSMRSSRGMNGRMDRNMDMRYSKSDYNYNDRMYDKNHRPMDYEMYGYGGFRPMYDMNYDMRGDYSMEDEDYKKELQHWSEKLRKHDRFGWNKEQIIHNAKQMGVEFRDFNEEELIATYYMLMSDFPNAFPQPQSYLDMAHKWLKDDDTKLKGSEKLCAYLYYIVLGETD